MDGTNSLLANSMHQLNQKTLWQHVVELNDRFFFPAEFDIQRDEYSFPIVCTLMLISFKRKS